MDSLFFQALQKANIGIILVDRDFRIQIWNGWMDKYSGIAREAAIGYHLMEVCPRFKEKIYVQMLHAAIYQGQSRFCSGMLHKAFVIPKNDMDEAVNKQNMQIEPLYEGENCYVLIQISDMTTQFNRVQKLRNLIKELELEYDEIKTSAVLNRHLALHDSLTGLPNRLLFNDRLSWAINYAQRNCDILAVMFLDLDGFKAVNDRFGHDIGDQVLIEAASRLKECIRNCDTIARLGGDEFTVVLSQLRDGQGAATVAAKFIKALDKAFEINGHYVELTVSIGISLYPRDGQESTILLKKADMAMYRVKKEGKNAFGFAR